MILRVRNIFAINKLAGRGRGVIVKFFSPECKPCLLSKPTFEKLSDEYHDISFVEVDVSEDRDLALLYKVKKVPTFIRITPQGEDRVERFDVPKLRQMLEKRNV